MLELEGFRFYTSLAEGEQSYVVTPALTAFPLRRARDLSLLLDGRFTAPGSFEVGPGPDSLLCDNGATTCIAGRDWARCIFRLPGIGMHLRGVGGVRLRSAGRGRVSIIFPDGAHLRWLSAPGLSLLTSKKCGLKILHPGGHLAAPRAPLLLQGARLVRADPSAGLDAAPPTPAAPPPPSAPGGNPTQTPSAPRAPSGVALPGSALEHLLQHSELTDPGLDARPSSRRTCRFRPLNQEQVVERLHLFQPPLLRELHRMALGVGQLTPPDSARLMPDHLIQSALRRRAVARSRTLGSRARDATLPMGRRWHVDMLPHLPRSLSGFVTGALFMEHKSSFLKLWLMRSGTAVEFGDVPDRHAMWVLGVHPAVGSLEIRGDSD